MIILLHLDAGPAARDEVRRALAGFDVEVEDVRLGDRLALVAPGLDAHIPAESAARLPHVERVFPMEPRAPLVRATRADGERTVYLGDAAFGGGRLSVIAGPCTVEDADQLAAIARFVRSAGAAALRGGAFKVRTSPHNYQGGGLAALQRIHAVSREVGLPFFTELNDPRQVSEVGDLLDGVQVGARHMQNFPLLTEVAALGKPILLKRHMAADLDEWLLAAEYILKAGNDQVILCERGIKTAERHVRYMLDVGAVPYLKQRIGLPVIVDPSHAAGHHSLVPALARAAVAAGADGLIVEVHDAPESTRCDAMQALPSSAFSQLMLDVAALARHDGRVLCQPTVPRKAAGGETGADDVTLSTSAGM